MNAILLGAASLGALVVFLTHDPHSSLAATSLSAQDPGSMTRTVQVDQKSGEKTEIRVIAFLD